MKSDAGSSDPNEEAAVWRRGIDILDRDGGVQVGLTTSLGVPGNGEVFDVKVKERILDPFIKNNVYRLLGLPMKVSEAVSLIIYFDSLRKLEASGDMHVLTLASGRHVVGNIPALLVTSA